MKALGAGTPPAIVTTIEDGGNRLTKGKTPGMRRHITRPDQSLGGLLIKTPVGTVVVRSWTNMQCFYRLNGRNIDVTPKKCKRLKISDMSVDTLIIQSFDAHAIQEVKFPRF